MAHFKNVLSNRLSNEVDLIEKKVLEWGSLSKEQQKIVSNLYKEHFSSVSTMDKFVSEMLTYISEPIHDFTKKVFANYNKYTFSGDRATVDVSVNKLGFSLTRHTLKTIIERDYFDYFFRQTSEIDNFLNLKSIGGTDPLYEHLTVKGENSTIWITWSETSDDPFDFIKHGRREEVYNALALSNYYITGPIFLFRTDRNSITNKAVLIRPSVFDAGSYPPFLPTDVSFKYHGFTDPYNDPTLIINGVPLINNKCPEVIIDGTSITWDDISLIGEL